MRIPTSSIVLGLVTCVPFGLAIRDSLEHKDPLADLEPSDEPPAVDDAEFQAQLARDEAERMAQEQQAKMKAEAARMGLFGLKPAQLGPMFLDVTLGEPMDVAMQHYGTLQTTDANIGLDFGYANNKLSRISISLLDQCGTFAAKVNRAWGDSVNGGWMSPEGKQRALLDPVGCTLVFEPTLDASAWIAALPIAAIGHPADTLSAKVELGDTDDSGFWWNDVGLGVGVAGTHYTAYVKNGKLLGFEATVESDPTTTGALVTALRGQRGAPKTDDTGMMTFSGKPTMELQLTDGHVNLFVGKLP